MSKLVICSVFDTKVGSFAAPFTCRSRGEAIRSFEDACQDDKMPFKLHPDDYQLFCLGEFDDQSGSLQANGLDRLIGAGDFST